jgi:hypothetical protein
MSKKLHDIEITVCPDLLSKQKQTFYKLIDDEKIEWTDEMREHMDGLLNLLDYIEDEVKFRDDH